VLSDQEELEMNLTDWVEVESEFVAWETVSRSLAEVMVVLLRFLRSNLRNEILVVGEASTPKTPLEP